MSVSAGQVEIAVSVGGAEQAIREFERLESTANKLDGRHVKITADAAVRDLNKQLGEIERRRFMFKKQFHENVKEANRLTHEIDKLNPVLERAEKHMTMFGYSKRSGLTQEFDVIKRNGKEVGLFSQAITDAQRHMQSTAKLGEVVNKRLKAGNNVYNGRVSSLKNVTKWTNLYDKALTRQTELSIQRDSLDVNWDNYYKQLSIFDTEKEGLRAAKDSYQAMSKETDVNNKLAKSLPPVVQKFKDFQSQLKTMDRSSALSSVNSKMEDLQGTLNLIRSKRAELGLPTGSEELDYQHSLASQQLGDYEKLYSTQLRQLTAQEKALMEYDTAQKHLETNIVRMGSRMQSLGNGIQRITSPFMNVFRGLTMGVGYQALNSVMQGITGAFSRYDTMKTYSIVLSELGMKTSKKFAIGMGDAKNAIDNLNDAVVGLPTGLDEIVASMRVYAGATGDVEKATKLAIAANNAFIAGGMDARQQLYTQRQLLALAGGEELESQSWSSIRRNAPMAFRAVAEQMKISVKDLSNGLKDGTINGQKFLDVFIKVGTEGRISKAAQKMKQTWDAVSQNIQNAFNRAGEGILKTLDSVFKQSDGRTFLQHVLGIDKNGKDMGDGIKGAIDSISQSAQEWIKNNPEEIIGFFDKLKSIDWAGIIRGFAGFAREFSGLMLTLGKLVGNETAIKWLLRGNMIGRLISVAGALTRGLAGPFSKAMLNGGVFAYIGSAIKSLAKYLPHFKKVSTAAPDLTKGMVAIGTVTDSMQKISWASVANKAVNFGGILAIAKSVEIMGDAMQSISKVKWNANTTFGLGAISTVLGVMTKVITSIGSVLGAAINSPAGKYIIGGTAVVEAVMLGIGKTIELIGKGVEGLAAGVDAVGRITTMDLPTSEQIKGVSDAIRELAKSFNDNEAVWGNLGDAISSWSKGLEAGAIKKIADAMGSIEQLSKFDMNEDEFTKAKENFNEIQSFAIDIVSLFGENDEKIAKNSKKTPGYQYGKSKSDNQKPTFASWKNQIRDFGDTIKGLSEGLTYVDSALMSLKKLNKDYANLNKLKDGSTMQFDWDILYYRISNLADNLYKLTDSTEEVSPMWKLTQAANALKGIKMSNITSAFSELPKIIGAMQRIYNKLTKASIFNGEAEFRNVPGSDAGTQLTNMLKPVIKAINQIATMMPKDVSKFKGMKTVQLALTRIKTIIGQLKNLSTNTDVGGINVESIKDAVSKIEEALTALEGLNEKEVTVSLTIKGEIDNQAKKEIDDAYTALEKSIKKFDKLSGPKNINVALRAHITGKEEAIAAAEAAIDAVKAAIEGMSAVVRKAVHVRLTQGGSGHASEEHSGGLMTHHGVVYKSNGGSIFRPRGIDTVPAMLAPGEYVINRNSARSLGYGLLQKLNHMDVRGALSSLAIRAGQNLTTSSGGGVVNNTTNNTRNANLTLNNYNSGGVGRARATNWIKSLNR